MKLLNVAFACLALAIPTSACATTGLLCTPITGGDPKLSIIIGAEGVMGAALFERGRWLSTMERNAPFKMMTGSIDKRHARVDLVGRGADRSKVRLRVIMLPSHRRRWTAASGTLRRLGRTYRVRCVQD